MIIHIRYASDANRHNPTQYDPKNIKGLKFNWTTIGMQKMDSSATYKKRIVSKM
jgi:hypothetical protein